MESNEVHELARVGVFDNVELGGQVEETHISWVILTRQHAFKIKKPVKLTFLDFSTLELRKALCEKELLLNRRFSDIYLSVQPICRNNGQWVIGARDGYEVVDYCVVMKKMDTAKRMDNRLRGHNIDDHAIRALALEVASFHNQAEKVFTAFDLESARKLFNDIAAIADFVGEKIGGGFKEIISMSMAWSDKLLQQYGHSMQQRIDHGLKRDLHGDLHTGNIFLYNRPVLFDCIEFNDAYRQIDVLYEIAFLCMDLEAFGQQSLSRIFLDTYRQHFHAFQRPEDQALFVYYKCLRANVRAKVHAIGARQDGKDLPGNLEAIEKYLVLMKEYMNA